MFGAFAWPSDLLEVGALEVGVRLTLLFYNIDLIKSLSYIDLLGDIRAIRDDFYTHGYKPHSLNCA